MNSIRTSPIGNLRVCPYRLTVATQYRMPKLTSRREYFRLPYPVTTGATLAMDGTNYTVGEISEGGLRLLCNGAKFPLEQCVQGTLMLTAGMRCSVTGTVLRVEDKCVIVKLSRGPTGYDVLREQRHLTKNFPDWKPLPA
ncbi:MAG TPA: PilZ domain-containing protein [Steroidobacteraceae bacterium]|nr:PilZ domain-containing protein [Steroidobacteraceae bacterium]